MGVALSRTYKSIGIRMSYQTRAIVDMLVLLGILLRILLKLLLLLLLLLQLLLLLLTRGLVMQVHPSILKKAVPGLFLLGLRKNGDSGQSFQAPSSGLGFQNGLLLLLLLLLSCRIIKYISCSLRNLEWITACSCNRYFAWSILVKR